MEGFPKPREVEEPRDAMASVIEGERLGGISAALEKIYNQASMIEALKKPEFEEVRELVEDFQKIAQDKNGSNISPSEAVGVLRIIAKEQKWNENHWNFDTIREEAKKMGYIVRGRMGSEYSERKAA